jgi:hypothetical protein
VAFLFLFSPQAMALSPSKKVNLIYENNLEIPEAF